MSEEFDWPGFLPEFGREAEALGFTRVELADFDEGALVVWERAGDGPVVYLSAGIHGDEPAGPLALLELMKDGFFDRDFGWRLCPALNPYGLARGVRTNGSGVDLNRDYLLRNSPETLAHSAWLESRPAADLFLSLHEDWETDGFYFYEINLAGCDPGRAAEILAAVEPWFPPEPGPLIDGHVATAPGWIYHASEADVPEGWPEAIFLAKYGCPLSYTFETPSRAPLASRVAAQVAAVRAACRCRQS